MRDPAVTSHRRRTGCRSSPFRVFPHTTHRGCTPRDHVREITYTWSDWRSRFPGKRDYDDRNSRMTARSWQTSPARCSPRLNRRSSTPKVEAVCGLPAGITGTRSAQAKRSRPGFPACRELLLWCDQAESLGLSRFNDGPAPAKAAGHGESAHVLTTSRACAVSRGDAATFSRIAKVATGRCRESG
jgi:hypothetical protein